MSRTRLPTTALGWAGWMLILIVVLAIGAWAAGAQRDSALRIAAGAGCRHAQIVDTTSFMATMYGCYGKHAIVYHIAGDGPDERPMKVNVCCRSAFGCDGL